MEKAVKKKYVESQMTVIENDLQFDIVMSGQGGLDTDPWMDDYFDD